MSINHSLLFQKNSILASQSGNLQLAANAIQKGADVNFQDGDGATPLMFGTITNNYIN